MIPALLKPRFFILKNRLKSILYNSTPISPILLTTVFSVTLGLLIFRVSTDILLHIPLNTHLSSLGAANIFLASGFLLILFTSLASILGSFFLAKDMEILLASPLSRCSLLLQRLLDSFLGSSWMISIFAIPIFISYVFSFKLDLVSSLIALIAILLLVIVAHTLSAVFVFTFVYCTNLTIKQVITYSLSIIILIIGLTISAEKSFTHAVFNNIQTIRDYLPTSLCLNVLQLLKDGRTISTLWPLTILSIVALSIITTFIFLGKKHTNEQFLYFSQLSHFSKKRILRPSSKLYQMICSLIPPQWISSLTKEYRLFARDIGQAIQMLLLIGICFMYLYNFQILGEIETRSTEHLLWWQAILVFVNLAMSSFVVIALCCRFVYPAVSLEGKTFWIIASSPLPLKSYLIQKSLFWGIPLAVISSTITASGALAINAQPNIVLTSAFCSGLITIGLSGIAVGVGAFFVQHDWSNPIELTTSLGSIVFMIIAVIILVLALVPVALLIILRTLYLTGLNFSAFEWYGAVIFCALLFMYFLFGSAKKSIELGQKAANRRLFD